MNATYHSNLQDDEGVEEQVFGLAGSPLRQAANRYIRKLRSPAKRDYAREYLAFKMNSTATHNPSPKGLSYMAAQAVRLSIDEILTSSPAPVSPEANQYSQGAGDSDSSK